MKWLGDHPFYSLLLLTEKPAAWPAGLVASVPLALGAVAGLLWGQVTGAPGWGWAAALGLLLSVGADWALLTALPRHRVSYGPVQPPLLALASLRWVVILTALPVGVRWPLPTWIGVAGIQLLVSALVAYGTMFEPFQVRVTHLELTHTRLANPGSPLRIVQLSDLHVERLTRREQSLPSLVAAFAPDLIVLTGDYLSTTYNTEPLALTDLGTLLGQLHAPGGIYAIWGTAEVDRPEALRLVLDRLGIVVLEDRAVEVQVADHHLWLIGLTCTRDVAADASRLRTLLNDVPEDAFTLLLYHTPDLMPEAASLGIHLYLAGHTHGGQWRVPGFGAIVTSSRYWKRYESGHYREGETDLYVSRGLGFEGFGTLRARFFCPPEVVVISLSGS